MTNPFEQPAQQQPASNPYATIPAPAQQPAAAGNPFGPGVPAQQGPPAAPQAYAQPAAAPSPYAQPQTYTPNAQPAYAPAAAQPQAYAQPQQQAAPAGPPPALGAVQSVGVAVAGEGKGAKFPDMYGRLALFFPLSLTRVPRNPQYITPEQRQRGDLDQERLVATVVVLDDGQGGMQPISYGGDIAAFPPIPNTESAPLPYVRKAMWITQTRMIGQLRDALPQNGGAPEMRLGRVVKAGPNRNDAWYLQQATEQDLALANQYLQLVSAGQYPHPLA